jgi:hypothetical protein
MIDVTCEAEFLKWFVPLWPEPKGKAQKTHWTAKRRIALSGWRKAEELLIARVLVLEKQCDNLAKVAMNNGADILRLERELEAAQKKTTP